MAISGCRGPPARFSIVDCVFPYRLPPTVTVGIGSAAGEEPWSFGAVVETRVGMNARGLAGDGLFDGFGRRTESRVLRVATLDFGGKWTGRRVTGKPPWAVAVGPPLPLPRPPAARLDPPAPPIHRPLAYGM